LYKEGPRRRQNSSLIHSTTLRFKMSFYIMKIKALGKLSQPKQSTRRRARPSPSNRRVSIMGVPFFGLQRRSRRLVNART
jgi:hypothetical protein